MSSRRHSLPWQPWEMGSLERRDAPRADSARRAARQTKPSEAKTRRQDDEIYQQLLETATREGERKGYEAGHAAGLIEGRAEGEAQLRAEQADAIEAGTAERLALVDRLVAGFAEAIAALDDRVADQLAELAIETGRLLAGRALEIRPEHIVDDIGELLDNHPGLTGSPTLYVAAEEIARIEHHLGQSLATAGWRLRADTTLAAGDCRIEDDEREIDSSQADRWSRLLQAVGHSEH